MRGNFLGGLPSARTGWGAVTGGADGLSGRKPTEGPRPAGSAWKPYFINVACGVADGNVANGAVGVGGADAVPRTRCAPTACASGLRCAHAKGALGGATTKGGWAAIGVGTAGTKAWPKLGGNPVGCCTGCCRAGTPSEALTKAVQLQPAAARFP